MRPRKVKRGDTVYEMHAKKNCSQTSAPGEATSLPNKPPSVPSTDRLGMPLPVGTAAAFAGRKTRSWIGRCSPAMGMG